MKKKTPPLPPHPMQPVVQDAGGTLRFRGNAIVRSMLDRDGGDLDQIASITAPPEDHVQLAQLLGLEVADRRFDAIRQLIPARPSAARKKRYDPQPMQPVYLDARGVVRFRKNLVVDVLLDRDTERGRVYPDFPARSDGGLNWIATQDFSQEDQEQFAQLIGYSVSGYHELSYVSDKSAAWASRRAGEILPDAGGCRDGGCEIHGGPIVGDDAEVQP